LGSLRQKKRISLLYQILLVELSISINKILDKIALNFKSFDDAFKIIKEFYSKKEEFKTKVNIKELYELTKDIESLSIDDIYSLFFTEVDYCKKAAIFELLLNDKIYFEFKDNSFFPRSENEVNRIIDSIKAKEENERKRKEIEENSLEWFKNGTGNIPDFVREYISPIIDFAIYQDESKNKHIAIERLEKISAINNFNISGDINYAAFRLCYNLGIFKEDENLLLKKYNIPLNFSSDELSFSENIAKNFSVNFENRIDLRNLFTFSIDDSTTKDIDDAISVEIDDDSIKLYIHIADVNEVLESNDLIETAKNRVSSIYLPDIKIPMLPPIISEYVSSLLCGTDRYAITYCFEFDNTLQIKDFKVFPSVVNIDKNFSYEEVDNILENKYGDLFHIFNKIYQISEYLQQRRLSNNGIEFSFINVYPVVENENTIRLKVFNPFSKSVNMVKELMILVNNYSAFFTYKNNIPSIYIAQDSPDTKIELNTRIVKDKVLLGELLKYMKKAYITTDPRPHYALGLNLYTQATSPIRRLLDLIVQRQIKNFIINKELYSGDFIDEIIFIINHKRSIISEIENEVNKYWLLKFLLIEYRNKKLDGIVLREINGSYLVEIEVTKSVAKISSKKVLEPGQKISVKLHTIIPRLGIALGNVVN